MKICEISPSNFNEWLAMGLELWPHYKKKQHVLEKVLQEELNSNKYKHYLIQNDANEYIGFINLSLRYDYVQGASSSPTAYIEGIYVKPEYRGQGVAKRLVNHALSWAQKQGCKELASDAELTNVVSQKFHERLGFKKVNTNVHYIMPIQKT